MKINLSGNDICFCMMPFLFSGHSPFARMPQKTPSPEGQTSFHDCFIPMDSLMMSPPKVRAVLSQLHTLFPK